VTALLFARWVHLVCAATWLGGVVVMGPLVLTLRRAGVERPALQAAARTFARVTWAALAIAALTGLLQVYLMHLPWSYPRLHAKLGAVGLLVTAVVAHQLTAARSPPAVRGAMEGLLLLLSLGVFAAAVAL
jgi:putative copper export protein